MRTTADAVVRGLVTGWVAGLYMRLLRVLAVVVPDPGELDHMVAMLNGEEQE